MAVEGVKRTTSAKTSAEVLLGGGVAAKGAEGTDGAVAGADEEGLNSWAGNAADLTRVLN